MLGKSLKTIVSIHRAFALTNAIANLFLGASPQVWGFDWHMHRLQVCPCNFIIARRGKMSREIRAFKISDGKSALLLEREAGPGTLCRNIFGGHIIKDSGAVIVKFLGHDMQLVS